MTHELVASGAVGPAFSARPTLEEQLEASVIATRERARFVDPARLPSEREIHSVHAQLSRAIREANRE